MLPGESDRAERDPGIEGERDRGIVAPSFGELSRISGSPAVGISLSGDLGDLRSRGSFRGGELRGSFGSLPLY